MVHSRCWTFCLISSIQLFNHSIKEAAVAVETKYMTTAGLCGWAASQLVLLRLGVEELLKLPSILPEGVQRMASTVPVLRVTYTLVS